MSFVIAMTFVMGLLALGDSGFQGGFLAGRPTMLSESSGRDPIFRIDAPLDRERWAGIVIHHLGLPAGDPDTIRQLHLEYGYRSLGYHFLVGNGRGMGEGDVYVGERWILQQPGAHAVGPDATFHNERSIGVCLVGNGDRRAFGEDQIAALVSVVRRLQRELGIPADRVFLHRDIASGVSSPGRLFPAARLREQLLD